MKYLLTGLAGLTLVAVLVPSLTQADCCKIPVIPPPPPNAITQCPEVNAEQGNPKAKVDTKPKVGDNQTGDGELPLPDSTSAETVQDIGSRRFFKEPSQTAVIAWNGKEEILVLSTAESALKKGVTMSFMPLTGEPIEIRKGDKKLFDKAYSLVLKHIKAKLPSVAGRNVVVYETKIGPHNFFVWRVDNPTEFLDKVQVYVREKFKGKAVALFNKKTAEVVKIYCDKGIKYFAFDVTVVETETAEKLAIEYHFKSKYLFYPLIISQGSVSGETKVELVVFTDLQGVNKQVGKLAFRDQATPKGQVATLGKQSVVIPINELRAIHPGMADLFNGQEIRGRIWTLRDNMDNFAGDLQMYHE